MVSLRTRIGVRALTASLAVVSGCGGGGGSALAETTPGAAITPTGETIRRSVPVHARGEQEVRARVGRAGGTLELANGVRLEIAEGALEGDIDIVFRTAPAAREAWDDETKRALGPSLEIIPAIRSNGRPFRLSCPALPMPSGFEPEDLALGIEEEIGSTLGGATATRWQMWPARIEGNRFVADLPAISGQRVQFGVSR